MSENTKEFVEEYNNFRKVIYSQTESKKLPIFNKRFREYNPDQASFYTFNPAEIFQEGCFERFLVNTIKNLDISDFEIRTTYDLGGPDEHNPKTMLAIIFYGESEGIFSNRAISKLCQYDQRYIFVSGGETPDHSTISRFINNYEKEIKEIFVKILYIADNMKYVDYKKLVTDGSKFKAYASEKFTGSLEEFNRRKSKLEERIKLAIEKQKQTDKEEEKKYWENKEERYKKDKEKIENFLKDAKEIYKSDNKEIKQNITDSDCRVMKMKNSGFSEAYNSQVTACEKNGIIVSCEVSNQANDNEMLQVMIEKTAECAPDNKKEKVKEAKQIFDNGYYTADNLIYCDKNNIDAYIPDGQDKNVYSDRQDDYFNKNKLTSRECRIDIINGEIKIRCPAEKSLILLHKYKNGNKHDYFYGIEDLSVCDKCKHKTMCINVDNKQKMFSFSSTIIDNYELIKRMHEKIRTDDGRIIYSRRMPTIEKIFGHFKKNLRFDRFNVIGLEKVRTRWSILCAIYNLKRIYNIGL
jgi:transposase